MTGDKISRVVGSAPDLFGGVSNIIETVPAVAAEYFKVTVSYNEIEYIERKRTMVVKAQTGEIAEGFAIEAVQRELEEQFECGGYSPPEEANADRLIDIPAQEVVHRLDGTKIMYYKDNHLMEDLEAEDAHDNRP